MDRPLRLTFRPGDLFAAAGVLLCAGAAALVLWAQAVPGPAVVQVRQEGAVVMVLPLGEDRSFDLEGDYRNTVTIRDGRVSITASDCPGGDCVHSGWVSAPGRSIVCLPNRVELRLVGEAPPDGVDGVSG